VTPVDDESMSDDEIRDLLTRLRAGDPAAREKMFTYVAERFRPLAHKLLRIDFPRVGLYAETSDILHDALCRLIPYVERSGTERATSVGQFHALTAMVLRHTLVDLARKLFGSLQSRPITEGMQAAHPLFQQSSGLNDWREEIRVHEMVERLPEPERTVINLSLYLGYGTTRIAECMGVHPGNISRRLSSAKEMLGRMLREDDAVAD
jgi:RNA polymerase sigma factor (sigma-70 family)